MHEIHSAFSCYNPTWMTALVLIYHRNPLFITYYSVFHDSVHLIPFYPLLLTLILQGSSFQSQNSAKYLWSTTAECPSASIESTEVITIHNPHLLKDLKESRHYLRPACSRQVQTVQLLWQYLLHYTHDGHFVYTPQVAGKLFRDASTWAFKYASINNSKT